ncbi:MAG TPA: hypothetical protein VFZ97_19020 [Acidimicrobiales bacterium]
MASATADDQGSCFRGRFGATITCGGGYVVGEPGYSDSAPHAPAHSAPSNVPPPVLVQYVANGPNGPCIALGPPSPNANATVTAWLTTLNLPPCPARAAAPARIDPQLLAEDFWKTIALPVPKPQVPPGYAITGMPAYLVTNSTTAPAPYVFPTPLGQLRIDVSGTYFVDWGDPRAPGWSGPYPFEGEAWPNGRISHTYDDVGVVNIVVREAWTATWHLGTAVGALGGLATTATIPNYPIQQEQSITTN